MGWSAMALELITRYVKQIWREKPIGRSPPWKPKNVSEDQVKVGCGLFISKIEKRQEKTLKAKRIGGNLLPRENTVWV